MHGKPISFKCQLIYEGGVVKVLSELTVVGQLVIDGVLNHYIWLGWNLH